MDLGLVRRTLRDCREGRVLRTPKLTLAALSALTVHPVLPPISGQTISNFELGKGDEPGFQTVIRMIEAMVPVSSFFALIEGLSPPAQTVEDPHPPGVEAVPSDPDSPALLPPLTYAQLEALVESYALVALEAHAGKFRENTRHASSDRPRNPERDPPTGAGRPYVLQSRKAQSAGRRKKHRPDGHRKR